MYNPNQKKKYHLTNKIKMTTHFYVRFAKVRISLKSHYTVDISSVGHVQNQPNKSLSAIKELFKSSHVNNVTTLHKSTISQNCTDVIFLIYSSPPHSLLIQLCNIQCKTVLFVGTNRNIFLGNIKYSLMNLFLLFRIQMSTLSAIHTLRYSKSIKYVHRH